MRTNKTNLRKDNRWLSTSIVLCALILSLMTSGCAEQVGTEDQCLQDLDNQSFSSVADNPDCSNYQRASAHMGLAGFHFSNFLKKNASDNFRLSLDIPDWEKNWENTPRQHHYNEARRLTGESTGDYYEHYPQARPIADTEVHLFASLASIISEGYIKFDMTPDGKITKEEVENFVNILPADTSGDSDGLTVDITVDTMLFTKNNGDVFLLEIKPGNSFDAKCEQCNKNGPCDYSGIFKTDGTGDFVNCGIIETDDIVKAVGGKITNITGSCDVVAKIKELRFFNNNNVGEVAANVVNMAGNLFPLIREVSGDLNDLNISQSSELRKNFNDFNNKFAKRLDSGETCGAERAKILDSFSWGKRALALVSKEPKSSYYDSSIDFNDLSSDIKKADIPLYWKTTFGGNLTFIFGCDQSTDVSSLKARLLFAKGDNSQDGYIPYYGKCDEATNDAYCCQNGKCGAKDSIQTSLITLDDISNKMSSVSATGDEVVSFKEMVCFEPTSDTL